MDIKELKEKNDQELDRQLEELRGQLRDMRFKDATGNLKKVREIREVRKTVARLLTVKRSRQAK